MNRLVVVVASCLMVGPIGAQATANGAMIFNAHCAGCHGAEGKGGELGPNITDGVDDTLFTQPLGTFIRHGMPDAGMPAFGGTLPARELDAIVAYITALRAPATCTTHPTSGAPIGVEPMNATAHNPMTRPLIAGAAPSCSVAFPVAMKQMAAKPATAPISIMPSMPRLRTPAFSTIVSPSAA